LVDDEFKKFLESLDKYSDEEKRKRMEEYIKTNVQKSEESKREMYSLLCFNYGYSFDELRAMNYPDKMILYQTLYKRMCERLGVPYDKKPDEKEDNDVIDVNSKEGLRALLGRANKDGEVKLYGRKRKPI
jgi:hypothetical protein